MRIGIISDTHGSVVAWEQALDLFRDVELIVHAGDVLYHGPRNPLPVSYEPKKLASLINNAPVPVIIARGNCDAEVDQVMVNWPLQSPYAFIQVDGLRLLVNHGHTSTPEQMLAQAQRHFANLFVFGHTHLATLTKSDGVLMLNPGSPSLPKDERETATVAVADGGLVRLIALKTGQVLAEAGLDQIPRGRA
ncbi:MAG: phosphodiesterase [Thermacetogeniaceae bacterium]